MTTIAEKVDMLQTFERIYQWVNDRTELSSDMADCDHLKMLLNGIEVEAPVDVMPVMAQADPLLERRSEVADLLWSMHEEGGILTEKQADYLIDWIEDKDEKVLKEIEDAYDAGKQDFLWWMVKDFLVDNVKDLMDEFEFADYQALPGTDDSEDDEDE